MRRLAWLCVLVVGCREPGTITIRSAELVDRCPGEPTHVIVSLKRDGVCPCTCDGCSCDNSDNSDNACVSPTKEGESNQLPITDLRDGDGIVLEPTPGRYAALYEYLQDGYPTVVACAEIIVEADGTSSSTAIPVVMCCPQ